MALVAYVACALIGRLLLTAHEKDGIARRLRGSLVEQERLAVTDGRTGLHKRRFSRRCCAWRPSEPSARGGRWGSWSWTSTASSSRHGH